MLARRLSLIDTDEAPAAPVPRLRVAIATQDLKSLNAHFGSAKRFAVYDVTPTDAASSRRVSFGEVSDETGDHGDDGPDRIGPKVAALAGCHLLFVLAIGGPAAAKVVGARIHPVKLPAPEPIDSDPYARAGHDDRQPAAVAAQGHGHAGRAAIHGFPGRG